MSAPDLAAWHTVPGDARGGHVGDADGFRYATNGHVLIRVPAVGDPLTPIAPRIKDYCDALDFGACTAPLPTETEPAVEVKCPECKGDRLARQKCERCDGEGVCTCPECDDEHDCGNCHGKGTVPMKGTCPRCSGSGTIPQQPPVRLTDRFGIARAYYDLLAGLTDVMIRPLPSGDAQGVPVLFVAREGCGAVMPTWLGDER